MSKRRTGPVRRSSLAKRASKMKRRLWAIYLAWKDPATPFVARLAIAAAIAYALSPIDLIPDFIPLLGQLDDVIIVPALIALALRLTPPAVAARCRREAWKHLAAGDQIRSPAGKAAAFLFALVWCALALWILSLLFSRS